MNFSVDYYSMEFLKFSGIESEIFQSGPSVSNTSFDIAYKMGCYPIIFMGQDLAFTNTLQVAKTSWSLIVLKSKSGITGLTS